MSYRIIYSQPAVGHLAGLTARDRRTIVDAVDRSLGAEPTVESRSRKRMRPNPLAPWELRVGEHRVYYDVVEGEDAAVEVLAIGCKRRNRVLIGEKEIEL